MPDVAVIGGGIVGCAAAALLAERGATVTLFERDEIAGHASGRNSGILQHPLTAGLDGLHEETLAQLRDHRLLDLPDEPDGLLFVTDRLDAVPELARSLRWTVPGVGVEPLDGRQLAELEPALAPGLAGCLMATGFAVEPAAATRAFAERARRAGAAIVTGTAVAPLVRDGRAVGVRDPDGVVTAAGAVLVAAGPWTSALVEPTGAAAPRIVPSWGVTVEVALHRPLRRPVEEAAFAAPPGAPRPEGQLFSLVTAGAASVLGSTITARRPDPDEVAPALLRRGERFVPQLAGRRARATRVCARPASFDGLPLLGPVGGVENLHAASGHGGWGISIGPATARIVCEAILDGIAVPDTYAADRLDPRGDGDS